MSVNQVSQTHAHQAEATQNVNSQRAPEREYEGKCSAGECIASGESCRRSDAGRGKD